MGEGFAICAEYAGFVICAAQGQLDCGSPRIPSHDWNCYSSPSAPPNPSNLRISVPSWALWFVRCAPQAMVALVVADALMQHKAQCELFPGGTLETMDTNSLGKNVFGAGVSA